MSWLSVFILSQVVTVDFMDEYDDEDPPSSSEEGEEDGRRYSTISRLEEDDTNDYEIV